MAIGVAANTLPPPVSMRWKITCVVDQKAEWKTDGQFTNDLSIAAPHVQTNNSAPVLIINSSHDSMLEMGNDGKFYSGDYPVDIIVSVTSEHHAESQGRLVKTITACWKI